MMVKRRFTRVTNAVFILNESRFLHIADGKPTKDFPWTAISITENEAVQIGSTKDPSFLFKEELS